MRRQHRDVSKSEIWDLLGAMYADRKVSRTRLVRAYESLEPQQRDVLRLRIEGMKQHEIADVPGTSQPTVSRLLAGAKQHITAALA